MIAIIRYNAGNVTSVKNILDQLGYTSQITDREEDILKADKVIFPGVGEAGSAMRYLKSKKLDQLIKSLKQPVLGICLGQQLMCAFSEEGSTECLGIFKTHVKKFPPNDIVPHMGWNNIHSLKSDLFHGVDENEDVYFVHSYYVELAAETIAQCDYQLNFSAALKSENFYATQFHPEKSAGVGAQILRNFLNI